MEIDVAPRKIIIDCDPGVDDAVALLMALSAPAQLEVLGITTVAGNVPASKTARNARLICELVGADVPIYAGCERPLFRQLQTAEHVHGNEGIDGIEIWEPARQTENEHAVDYILNSLRRTPDNDVTLVAIGPLTNIAMAIHKAPDILTKIQEIVVMGGAFREGGNVTPSAEFNIFVDPHAADIVFRCGRPLTVFGLDVTHQVFTSAAILERIRVLNSKPAMAAHGMLTFFGRYDSIKFGGDGAPLHDPCTIAYLLKPDLFEFKHCNIQIETNESITVGHTSVDFWNTTDRPKNARWAYSADSDGFFRLLIQSLGSY